MKREEDESKVVRPLINKNQEDYDESVERSLMPMQDNFLPDAGAEGDKSTMRGQPDISANESGCLDEEMADADEQANEQIDTPFTRKENLKN